MSASKAVVNLPILRPHKRRISSVTFTSEHLYGNVYMRVGVARALVDSYDFGISGGAEFTKM